jgi:hypothetical protein
MNILGRIKDKITRYIDVYLRLAKLNVIDKVSGVFGYFIFILILLFLFFCVVLFLGLGVVELFMLLGFTKAASFFLTIGVYLLLLALVVALRKRIITSLSDVFIRKLTEGDTKKEEKADDKYEEKHEENK